MVTTAAEFKETTTSNGTSGKGKREMAKAVAEEKARGEALDRAVTQIQKTYGPGAIMRLDAEAASLIPGISTGALSLDIALGGRGLPRGRVA